VDRALPLITFAERFAHRIAGIRNDVFELHIAESLSRFCRDRNKFLGQVDLDGRHMLGLNAATGARCSGTQYVRQHVEALLPQS
jgi:hypothetical protein